MLFYAQKLPKKDLFAHASQYCMGSPQAEVLAYSALSTQSAETDRQNRGFQGNSELSPRDCCAAFSQNKKGFWQAYLVGTWPLAAWPPPRTGR
jgi:hypothetical protein